MVTDRLNTVLLSHGRGVPRGGLNADRLACPMTTKGFCDSACKIQ
jgi:hypothetical protein